MIVTGTGKQSTHHVNGRVSLTVIGYRGAVEKEKKKVLKNLSHLIYLERTSPLEKKRKKLKKTTR